MPRGSRPSSSRRATCSAASATRPAATSRSPSGPRRASRACRATSARRCGTRRRGVRAACRCPGGRPCAYVRQQLDFGPRVPNTPGHDKTGDWILARLRATADTVAVQPIRHLTQQGATLHLRNLFARFRPELAERVLFLAHWDTRPRADQSPNLGQQRLPVPGADDGASGVAVLLGVADALKAKPPAVGVDLLFVDGEDYGDFTKDSSDVLIGSRWFAAHQPRGYPPLYAVLFDMVGDRSLQIYYEGNSMAGAPEVVERVWRTASDLGYGRYFLPGVKHTLIDDHVSLH